jgi:hypothetical protein
MDTVLTAERVNALFIECLFQDGEQISNAVVVQGITTTAQFDPKRLESNQAEIAAMLDELPSEFQIQSGGGMSFLNACDDKYGRQWTDLHATMERLFLLGMAIGKVTCIFPREIWSYLPGGMPYYAVN